MESDPNADNQEPANSREVGEIPKFRVYFYRFIALLAFDLVICCNAILYSYLGPLIPTICKMYDLNAENWMLLNSIFGLLTIPSTFFLAIPLIEKHGVHISMVIGVIGILIGTWCKVFINKTIYFLAVNWVLFGISASFISVAITKVSVRWFPPSQRVMATFFTNIIRDLSMFLACISQTGIDNWDISSMKQNIYNGLLMEAILASVLLLAGVLLYRERPKTPPSPADDTFSMKKKSKVTKGLLNLAKNKNFVILLIRHTLFLTMAELKTANNGFIYMPFNINPQKAVSYSAMAGVTAGLVSSSMVGILLNKYKRFKLTICTCMFLMSGVSILQIFIPYTESVTWVMLGTGLAAFVSNPEISTVMEFSMELGYPVGETPILGLITTLSIPLGIIAQESIKDMLHSPSKTKSVIFQIVVVSVYFSYAIAMLFVKEELRRDRRDTSIMEGLPYDTEYFFSVADENGESEGDFQLTPVFPLLQEDERNI